MRILILTITALIQFQAFAHDMPAAPKMPAEFDTLKKLVGTWQGTSKANDGKEETVNVVYELTSNGSAITEKLMPGTPHEMISIYYKEGKSLAMTHYCAIGNHPQMKLKSADPKSLAFEMNMKQPVGISSPNEMHMHSVKLTLVDDNTLKQEWQNYDKGKPGESVVFTVKRKK